MYIRDFTRILDSLGQSDSTSPIEELLASRGAELCARRTNLADEWDRPSFAADTGRLHRFQKNYGLEGWDP